MRPLLHLLIAGEQRQDREAGRVGARPARRAQLRLAQAPASRPSPPSSGRPPCAGRTARRACSGRGRRAARGGRRRPAARPRSARRAGSGSARGRTRRRTRTRTFDSSSSGVTTSYGMPIGPPSHSPEPKSAWIEPSRPIERTIAAESGATGSVSTRWLVENEAGNSGQPASVAAAVGDRGEHHAGSIGRAPGRVSVTASPPPGAAAAATVAAVALGDLADDREARARSPPARARFRRGRSGRRCAGARPRARPARGRAR